MVINILLFLIYSTYYYSNSLCYYIFFNRCWIGSEVAFSSRVPEGSSMAWRTNIDIYIVPSNGAAKPISISQENMGSDTGKTPLKPLSVLQHLLLVPVYSPDGNNIAWLEMRTPGFEADLQKIVIFNRKTSRKRIILENWDRSAESLLWSPDSQYLYITAQDKGHVKVLGLRSRTKVSLNSFRTSMLLR